MIVLGALVAAVVFGFCAFAYLHEGVREDALVVVWWVSGLAAAGLGVAACAVEDDGVERPRYLVSIVSGLRSEWRHTSASRRG